MRSGLVDIVILPHLTRENVVLLGEVHLDKLLSIVEEMVAYKPFPVVTVHDEFKCHANNMNYLRMQYREILADIAESNLLDDLLSQLYKTQGTFPKKSPDLAHKIRKSNYALS
jgi:ribosome-interacting GTPase 1